VNRREQPLGFWLRLALAGLSLTQIQASCSYAPPPLLSSGQGAESLSEGRYAAGVEAGFGTSASWWNAQNMTDVDVNSKWVGGLRLRRGMGANVDLGIVGGVGPQRGFVVGPEFKWRFAHLAAPEADGPAFHAAWVSGLGVGASDHYDPGATNVSRDVFLAPYTGIIGSGGVQAAQMYVGFRFAASDNFFNHHDDLTLYPALQFGFLAKPTPDWSLFIETDLAGGLTTQDFGDSALIFYPTLGISYSFGSESPAAAP
jgi:hypothetical protein